MLGYSGGVIATEWAAELASTYAPDVNARMIGAAMGGVLVDPAHNLHYIENTYFWAGVMPLATSISGERRTNSSIDATGGALTSARIVLIGGSIPVSRGSIHRNPHGVSATAR